MNPLLLSGLLGVGGSLLDKFGGNKVKMGQASNYTPEQSDMLRQMLGGMKGRQQFTQDNPLYGQGSSVLSDLLGAKRDTALEAPLMQQFQQETMPQIAERFSGSSGSSGLNQALSKAAEDLMMQFGAMRSQNRNSALQQALGYAQLPSQEYQGYASTGLGQRAFTPTSQEQAPGFMSNILSSMAPMLGQKLGGSLFDQFSSGGSGGARANVGQPGNIASKLQGQMMSQPFTRGY